VISDTDTRQHFGFQLSTALEYPSDLLLFRYSRKYIQTIHVPFQKVRATRRRGKPHGEPDLKPTAYADADWGADPKYCSTTGYIIFVNGAPVRWRSQRQQSVSKLSTEAEYVAASEAAGKLIWLNDLMIDARWMDESPAPLWAKETNYESIITAQLP
jgi:hypothetical protein